MTSELDARFMRMALRLAERGRPSPNPHVGAVLVRDGDVLATGYHARAGGPHAELAALDKLGGTAPGATLYVTLEPCNHHGRTPPCSEALLRSDVRRVVIGAADPIAGHAGGAARLREAGLEVVEGVERERAETLIADFRTHALLGRPYVVLKAAVTLDGRMAAATGDSRWITGERARTEAHRMRDRADAVLVGVGTVLADDPALTVRHVRGRDPIRVVLDSHLRTPETAAVLARGEAPCWIVHGPTAPMASRQALMRAGAQLFEVPARGGHLDLSRALGLLAERHVVRLLVEGGATLHSALLDAGLCDWAAVFVAPRILADPEGIPLARGHARARMAQALSLRAPRVRQLGPDVLFEGALSGGVD